MNIHEQLAVSAGYALLKLTPDLLISAATPNISTILHQSPAELVGQPLAAWLTLNTAETTLGQMQSTTLPARPHGVLQAIVLRDQDTRGFVVMVRATQMPITDETAYRALFEQTQDAVFILDLDGHHLQANQRAAEMFGYNMAELRTLSARDLVVANEFDDSQTVRERMLAGETIPLFERNFRRKDGSLFTLEVNVSLVRDADGRPLQILSILRDVQERHSLHDEIQNTLRTVETTSNISNALIAARSLEEMLEVFASVVGERHVLPATYLYMVRRDEQQRAERLELIAYLETDTPTLLHPLYTIAEHPLWQRLAERKNRMTIINDTADMRNSYEQMVGTGNLSSTLFTTLPKEGLNYLSENGVGGVVFVPLTVQQGRWVGVVVLAWGQPITLAHERLLPYRTAAQQMATLVENRDLFGQTQQSMLALQASEQRLATVLNNAPIAVFAFNAEGYFTLARGVILERSAQTWLGRHYSDIAAFLPSTVEAVAQALQGVRIDHVVQSPDGQSYRIIYIPLETRASGQGNRVIGVVVDVSEQERLKIELESRIEQLSALRRMEAEFSEVLDSDYVLTVALDAAIRLSRASSGYIGLLDGEHTGQLRLAAAVGRYQKDAMLQIEGTMVGLAVHQRRAQWQAQPMMHSAGAAQPVAQMCIPLQTNQVVGVLVLETPKANLFTDTTFDFTQLLAGRIASALDNARLYQLSQLQLSEMRELFDQVKRLENVKTDMIRIASHDLRNPLSTAGGYVELMKMDSHLLQPEHLEFLDAMSKSLERMQQITSDILSLERIEESARNTSGKAFDLRELVHKAAEEIRDQANLKAQTFTVELPEAPMVMVMGDPIQLHEATVNLINNAVKYTPNGGTVAVSLETKRDLVFMRVKDTGFGIPTEMQDRLFEPFYRAKTEETRDIEGTGLGLHLVKNIIERHNGRMLFESEYGKGSLFGYTLETIP
jgi:PAS domain S-box-containing protein